MSDTKCRIRSQTILNTLQPYYATVSCPGTEKLRNSILSIPAQRMLVPLAKKLRMPEVWCPRRLMGARATKWLMFCCTRGMDARASNICMVPCECPIYLSEVSPVICCTLVMKVVRSYLANSWNVKSHYLSKRGSRVKMPVSFV